MSKYGLIFIVVAGLALGLMIWSMNNFGYATINVGFEDTGIHLVLFEKVKADGKVSSNEDDMFFLFPGSGRNDVAKVFVPSSWEISKYSAIDSTKKFLVRYTLGKGSHLSTHFIKVKKDGSVEIEVIRNKSK